MKSHRYTTPNISARDRFAFTLFMSVLFNAVFILGVGFKLPELSTNDRAFPTIDVILVEKNDSPPPEEADYLAQHNQSGTGNSEQRAVPSTPEAALPIPVPIAGNAELLQPQHTTDTAPLTAEHELLTQSNADIILAEPEEPAPEDAKPSAAQLIALSKQVAQLSAEINQSMEIYAKQPKHRFIAANSKAYRDAAYLDAWRQKIERVGNLNYPEEAKRRKISGSLIMDVAINADGTINEVTILQSSGKTLLDDAAKRIVRLASPFAPLPEEMRADTDILHITRTWQFTYGNTLSTQ